MTDGTGETTRVLARTLGIAAGGRVRDRGARRARALVAVAVAMLLAMTVAAPQALAAQPPDSTLSVTRSGLQMATVSDNEGQINCGTDCTGTYPAECTFENDRGVCMSWSYTVVTLSTTPPAGFGVVWGEPCMSGTQTESTCAVPADSGTVNVYFDDLTGPQTTLNAPAAGAFVRGTIDLRASAFDPQTGVDRVQFAVGGINTGFSDDTAPYSVRYVTTSRADGPVTVRATAYNGDGDSSYAEGQITIDNTKPVVSISGGPADGATFGPNSTQTWSFSASDATSGLQSVRCSVVSVEQESDSFGACSGNGAHSVTNRPEGTYRFAVQAQDRAGNEPTLQSRTFSIDATPPETTMNEVQGTPAQGSVVDTGSATFAFSSEDGALFECALDRGSTAGTFDDCESTKTYSDLRDGEYTFRVRAIDAVGNVEGTPATRTWTVARAPLVLMDTIRPLAGEKNVLRGTNVEATFSETMKGDSLTTKTVKLQRYDRKKRKWRSVPTMLTLTDGGTRVVLDPFGVTEAAGTEKPLPAKTKLRVTVSTEVRDAGGTPLIRSVAWTFKTGEG